MKTRHTWMKKTKKKENKAQELIDFVFSWSIAEIMNEDLYKDKVNQIPKTFSSAENYLNSFISPIIEETHADLNSKFTTLFHAPSCEIYDVNCTAANDEELLYVVSLKPGGAYEPEYGDLIALTEVKPRGIDDLDRPKRPYTIALVKGMRKEDSDEIKILSSKPIMFEKQDKENGIEGDIVFAVYLTNLITNSRIWKALHPDMIGGNFDIINSVSRTNLSVEEELCSICSSNEIESLNVSKSREYINPLVLDNSQKHAVLNCIATRECHHKNTVKLIWGPPGTGKTKTISALVLALMKIKCRTLTCAPTNIAVIGVTKRLMSLLGGTLVCENYGLGDIVLFGNGERMKIDDHKDLFDVFLDNRVKVLAKCFAPPTGWNGSLLSMIGLLEDPEDQYLRFLIGKKAEILEESEKVDNNKEEKERSDLKSKKDNEGKNEIGMRKGKLKMAWKEVINHDLEEAKKKNLTDRERRKSKKDKNKNEKEEASGNSEKILCTFEEFFTKAFKKYEEQLMLCVAGLFTHMPTSHLPLEVVKKMIRVLEIIPTLRTFINSSKGSLRQELKGNEETLGTKHANNMSSIRLQCLEVLKSFHGSFSVPKYIEHYQIRSFCLTNAILIFCTASSSAKLYTEGSKPIELVIIDEAAQLKECESSIPLQLSGIRHVVLVGDEKQLPAMVQSKICEKSNFGRSLFERLVILGHSKHLLNVQYRMHPSISLFPNREFYEKKIKNGQNVIDRTYERRFLKGKIFGSYSFIDVNNGKEEFDDRYSKKNMVEVSVVAAIVSKLYQESAHSKQKVRVGCISPYKAQVHAIQERLGKTYSTDINDKFSVNVRSVDGFQGGEEDIIIISTVRCNGNGAVGFLSNCQRTNVALTRARYCLWIIGNGSTLLNSGSVWKKLVLDAKSRGCFFNAYEDKSLSLAISNALVELGQLNSLFSMDSILFKTSNWKRLKIHEDVVSILVKLSNGWRQLVKDDSLGHVEGPCSQLLEIYDVKGPIKLIWSIDIFRENSEDIQVIKIWEVVPRIEVPKLVNKLDAVFGNYMVNFMSRCLCKRIEGDLTLPMKWPVVTNRELSRQLSALSLGDEPRQSRSRYI
ncbi:hypothetical protein ACJIZ3_023349 [Penstemon smallii]|uniref:Helicase MAGATAMA 3 n=1 Tax=Penstemon smallii TaxID=265156 RepID=A0ABD3TRR9_9LAMI